MVDAILPMASNSLWQFDREYLFFDRSPHGRVIGVPQHTLDIVGIRRVDHLLIL